MLDALDRVAARVGRFALSPRSVFAIWAAIILFMFVMRAFLFSGTDPDTSEQLICMQDWALGCGPRNPPLFTWLGRLALPVFGKTIAAVIFVKFAVTAACLFLLYRSSRIVLQDRALAALVTLSPIAIYYFAWDGVFHYTHSMMVAFAVCLTFYLMLVLERRHDLVSYVLFGLSIGVGALSKFNYLVFHACLLLAMAADPALRRVLLDRRMLLAGAIGVGAASPFYLWLWANRSWTMSMARDRFIPSGAADGMVNWIGFGELFLSVINFILPLAIFLIVFFPRAIGPGGAGPGSAARYRRLLEITYAAILALTLVGVVSLGAARNRAHYMFVVIMFPLLFMARAQAAGIAAVALNRLAMTLVVFAVIVPAGILVKYAIDPLRGSKAYYHVPYADLAAQLRAAGFRQGTILGDWLGYPLAGNFLPYFPESRIVNLLDLQLAPKDIAHEQTIPVLPPDSQGQCLMLWAQDPSGRRRGAVIAMARKLLDAELSVPPAPRTLSAPFLNGRGREFVIEYVLLPGTGNCR